MPIIAWLPLGDYKVEVSLLYREVEEQTLRRDELISKLRRQVDEFRRGVTTFMEVRETLQRLRRARRLLLRSLSNSKKNPQLEGEYAELVKTLLEFTLWVSINDEKELMLELRDLMVSRGAPEPDLKFVLNELSSVDELKDAAEGFLNSIGHS